MISDLARALENQRFLPVIRSESEEYAIRLGRALREAGVDHIELTTPIPNVIRAVEVLADEGCTVGVGTVRESSEIRAFADAGARFVVSYFNPVNFVTSANDAGVFPIPGAVTPSEIQRARDEGASLIKLFPAWMSHPRIISDLKVIIPGVRYIATGGITLENASKWLRGGALAVGVGSGFGPGPEEDSSSISSQAVKWRAATAFDHITRDA